jgi:hypothetical protein
MAIAGQTFYVGILEKNIMRREDKHLRYSAASYCFEIEQLCFIRLGIQV